MQYKNAPRRDRGGRFVWYCFWVVDEETPCRQREPWQLGWETVTRGLNRELDSGLYF
jgi:hypothetical protein